MARPVSAALKGIIILLQLQGFISYLNPTLFSSAQFKAGVFFRDRLFSHHHPTVTLWSSASDVVRDHKVRPTDSSSFRTSSVVNTATVNPTNTVSVGSEAPKANARYPGRKNGNNKHFYESRRRQLDAVLLVVRNQTRSRVAFTLTDVSDIKNIPHSLTNWTRNLTNKSIFYFLFLYIFS